MLPGSNAMDVAEAVKARDGGDCPQLPIRHELWHTVRHDHIYQGVDPPCVPHVFEALLLVILVVFLSLQNWRATLIPVIAGADLLIGTFGVMLIFGFSLNMLTLSA